MEDYYPDPKIKRVKNKNKINSLKINSKAVNRNRKENGDSEYHVKILDRNFRDLEEKMIKMSKKMNRMIGPVRMEKLVRVIKVIKNRKIKANNRTKESQATYKQE